MFVKVFEQIFSSSIMEEDLETRYIWFCFLALADREGFIDMTIPAIARRINVSEPAVINSIQKFMAIDASSRTETHEGRRLEKVRDTFGWRIVNYVHYRDLQTEASRREYMREYMRTKRNVNKKANVNINSKQVLAVLGHTDTDLTADLTTDRRLTPCNDYLMINESLDNDKTMINQSLKTKIKIKTIDEDMDMEEDMDIKGKKKLSPLQELWNSICLDLPKVKENSKGRETKEVLRLKERSLENWKTVFETINNSDFCKGQNDQGWQASYDWILSNDTNAAKVLEGKYANRNKPKTKSEENIEIMRKGGLIT